ncbi:MAG TPA: alpha-amylase, partial [Anaerolineae bacterium]|nr:alpha-amylase [Anaerolineae bacterium]
MSERFGAWQVGTNVDGGQVEFKLFMPDRAHDPAQYAALPPDGRSVADYGDPKIVSIRVAGSFQHGLAQKAWDFEAAPELIKQPHPKGWVWTYRTPQSLPQGYYEYKYYVTFEDGTRRKVSDPCTRYGGRDHQNSAFTIGGTSSAVAIKPVAGGRKPLRDLVLYELMIDDFTDEYRAGRAPIDAVRDRLDYLKDQLGVNAILF